VSIKVPGTLLVSSNSEYKLRTISIFPLRTGVFESADEAKAVDPELLKKYIIPSLDGLIPPNYIIYLQVINLFF